MINNAVYEAIIEESAVDLTSSFVAAQSDFVSVGIDSLSIVSVIILLEDKYDITITGKEITALTSIQDLIILVESKT